MPELPEVESLRRSLIPFLIGRTIQQVEVRNPKIVSSKGTFRLPLLHKIAEFEEELVGETILSLERIAKNLIIHLKSGKLILIHLKMTGQLVYHDDYKNQALGGHPINLINQKLPFKHTHIIITLDKGILYYNDTRAFGYVLYYPNILTLDAEQHFIKLGIDPLSPEFSYKNFKKHLVLKKGVLKSVFLNQEVVTGLGNIYCDEVCFEAKVLPMRKIDTLIEEEIRSIYNAIQKIIPRAIELGGSSVANYLLGDGSKGNFAHEHAVYKRAGKDCYKCGSELKKTVISSRTTVYCSVCQR